MILAPMKVIVLGRVLSRKKVFKKMKNLIVLSMSNVIYAI